MKKKILFIYGQLNGGGAERVLLDLLRNFDYSRYDVDLCQIVGGGVLRDEVPSQVSVIELWSNYTLSYKLAIRLSDKFGWNFMFKQRLKKKLTKQYDVEISFLEGFPLKIHAMMNTAAKKITWVHCDLYQFHYTASQFRSGEELAAYNKMDTVVCVADDTLKAFDKRFPQCKAERIRIYNPIDVDKIISMGEEFSLEKNERFTVVTVGRLTRQKKMDRVIRVARRFKSEGLNVNFQILGDGELMEALQQQCRDLDVEDRVQFLGFKKNPFPYVKNADVMFSCSGYEGFCLVICEAMCLGVPVVSTKTAGPIEILDNDKYGLLTEHDDESMFQAVKRLMSDAALRKHYVDRGRERVEKFRPNVVINEIEQLL